MRILNRSTLNNFHLILHLLDLCPNVSALEQTNFKGGLCNFLKRKNCFLKLQKKS